MSEFILQIEQLISAFGDAEYRYLLLEPLIFFGILIGVFMLSFGFFFKVPKLQLAALVVIGIAALAHVPYKDARLSAQPRMEKVYRISSPARVKGFEENTEAWIASSWKFRLLVLAAAACIMIGINRNRFGYGLGIATAILGLIVAKNAMWLHYQDALAYHPNLKRHEAPIDKRESVAPPPARTVERKPSPASGRTVAPAAEVSSPTRNLSTQVSSERIPLPEVPAGPRPRPVAPLPR